MAVESKQSLKINNISLITLKKQKVEQLQKELQHHHANKTIKQ